MTELRSLEARVRVHPQHTFSDRNVVEAVHRILERTWTSRVVGEPGSYGIVEKIAEVEDVGCLCSGVSSTSLHCRVRFSAEVFSPRVGKMLLGEIVPGGRFVPDGVSCVTANVGGAERAREGRCRVDIRDYIVESGHVFLLCDVKQEKGASEKPGEG